jgi:hypothetical protein
MSFREQRLLPRRTMTTDAFIFISGEQQTEHRCLMLDYSETGARLHLERSFAAPSSFLLRIPGKSQLRLATVRWRHEDNIGVEFIEPEAVNAKIEFLAAEIATLRLRVDNLRAFVEKQALPAFEDAAAAV